eukprot:SAG11_NODE_8227_length_1044_cov_1.758730_1_plen_64_part_00
MPTTNDASLTDCAAQPYTIARGFSVAEYARHSNQAHGVFALSILCSLISYGVFFVGTQGRHGD